MPPSHHIMWQGVPQINYMLGKEIFKLRMTVLSVGITGDPKKKEINNILNGYLDYECAITWWTIVPSLPSMPQLRYIVLVNHGCLMWMNRPVNFSKNVNGLWQATTAPVSTLFLPLLPTSTWQLAVQEATGTWPWPFVACSGSSTVALLQLP